MDRISNAVEKFYNKYACSQAILSEYSEHFNLDVETALKLAAGFAAGMRQGETCGAVTGAYMVLGLQFSAENCVIPEGRKDVYTAVSEFTKRFQDIHGSTRCDVLIGCNMGTPEGMQEANDKNLFQTICPKFVKSSAEILESMLEKI